MKKTQHIFGIGSLGLAIWLGAYFFSKVDATPHPKHRLYLNADREEGGDCHLVEYIAAWSPCYYFWMPFSQIIGTGQGVLIATFTARFLGWLEPVQPWPGGRFSCSNNLENKAIQPEGRHPEIRPF